MLFRSFFIISSFFLTYAWGEQTVTYQASLEGKETKTHWVIEENQNTVEILGKNKGNDIKLKYSPSFSLLHYFESEPKASQLDIHREDSNLIVKNNTKAKILKIGNLPWIQEFKFGFQPFLKTSDKELFFGIVYNKDTSLHEMIATKESIEKITVAGQIYEAQKLKITLKGFKKRFWKAEAWFDLKTNLMVKYRSNEGPGTPPIEVTLIQDS